MQATQTNLTAPLLRVDQIDEMEGDRETLKKKLANPAIEDKATVADQMRRLDRQLETQRPRPYSSDEIDGAIRREAELRGSWTAGMLSHEEMRKAPPGSVDRHRAWEKRNKPAIAEWQNIQRRLNAGSDDRESASIERFRPLASTMNMQGALIPGKEFFLPPEGAATGVVFSDEDLALVRVKAPEVAEMLGLMSNEQRAQAKEKLVERGIIPGAAAGLGLTAAGLAKTVLSEEEKAAKKGKKAK